MDEMTDKPLDGQAETTSPYDRLERITIATDGGRGGRGSTECHFLTPEDASWLRAEAFRRRIL